MEPRLAEEAGLDASRWLDLRCGIASSSDLARPGRAPSYGRSYRLARSRYLDQAERGRAFEQFLIQEVRRMVSYDHPEAQLYFWRTHNGAEVDLLLERHGRLRFAAEIECRATVASADLSGLRSFREAHPTVPVAVVCTAPRPSRIGEVDVLPYADFLDRLPEWIG